MNYIAMAGFFLSGLSYLSHVLVGYESLYFVMGMILLVFGYGALFTSKLLEVLKERKLAATKKRDDTGADMEELSSTNAKTLTKYFGYAALATFFGIIFIKPEFTLHVRFYDAFAAMGYFALLLTKYIPLALAVFPVLLYYIFGAGFKIKEEGWINRLQLVARTLLVVYYGATWIGSLHLF